MKKLLFLTLLVICSTMLVMPSLAAVITFEEGIPVPDEVLSQYCNDPITNFGVNFLYAGRIFDPGIQTASGTHALTNNFTADEFGRGKKISMQFTTDQKSVSVKIGLDQHYSGPITAILKTYNSPIPDGNPNGQSTYELGTGPTPITHELSVSLSTSDIQSIEIEFIDVNNIGISAYEVIDDLTFDSVGPLCIADTGNPTVVISTPTSGQIVQNPYNIELAYTATDTETGIARIQVASLAEDGGILRSFDACGGPNRQPCAYTIVPTTVSSDYITTIPDKAHSIRVTAWDFAGHSGQNLTSFTVVPVGYPNLWIKALEITQATQPWLPVNYKSRSTAIPTFDYPPPSAMLAVPLVAKKTTVVRVFPGVEGTLNNLPINGITAELWCFVDSGYSNRCPEPSMILPQNQPPPSILREITVNPDAALISLQTDSKLSWNFLLPEVWTNAGTIYLEAKGKMPPGMKECDGCDDGANAIRVSAIPFQTVPSFDDIIHVMKTKRTTGADMTFEPTQDQIKSVLTENARLIPIDEATISTTLTTWSYMDSLTSTTNDRCYGLYNALKKIPNTGKWKVIFALVDDKFDCKGVGWDGYAYGMVPSPSVIAHEGGHGVNLLHAGPPPGHGSPPCPPPGGGNCAECNPVDWCNQYWPYPHGTIGAFGFNTQEMKVIVPDWSANEDSWHDFMAYCPPTNRWASPWNWIRMFNGFTPAQALSAQQSLSISGTSSRYLIVGGNQRDDNTWILDPAYELELPSGMSDQSGTGDYRIVLVDSTGKELGSHAFSIHSNHIDMEDLTTGDMTALSVSPSFVEVIPLPDEVEKIELHLNGDSLTSLSRSPNVPSVNIVSPTASGFSDPPRIEWTATDLEVDPLRYMIQYSTDPTQNDWETLAVDLTVNELPIDLADLPGSSCARVRVLATDGLNTGSAISLPFAVDDKPPIVTILSPSSGTTIERRDRLVLMGTVSDLEDGVLEGGTLSWSSDRDGFLGTGNRLDIATLTPGEHLITLTAQDRYGQSGTATIGVKVIIPLNRQPIANVGPDRTTIVGVPVQLDGTVSFDENGDPLSYSWSIVVAPNTANPILNGGKTAQPTFSTDVAGDYEIELTVDDGMVASRPDRVRVEVSGGKPDLINPGGQSVSEGKTLRITLVASDKGGDPLIYSFTSTKTLQGAIISGNTFTWTPGSGSAGTYSVTFKATNTKGLSDEETIKIIVNVPINVKIVPKTINLGSKGYFLAFVTLPEAYKGATIDMKAVSCSGALAVRMMKLKIFPRIVGFVFKTNELKDVPLGKRVTLTVEGELKNKGKTYTFTGSDDVKVISKPTWQPDDIRDVTKDSDDQLFKKFNI